MSKNINVEKFTIHLFEIFSIAKLFNKYHFSNGASSFMQEGHHQVGIQKVIKMDVDRNKIEDRANKWLKIWRVEELQFNIHNIRLLEDTTFFRSVLKFVILFRLHERLLQNNKLRYSSQEETFFVSNIKNHTWLTLINKRTYMEDVIVFLSSLYVLVFVSISLIMFG